jgi:hypothetical protein
LVSKTEKKLKAFLIIKALSQFMAKKYQFSIYGGTYCYNKLGLTPTFFDMMIKDKMRMFYIIALLRYNLFQIEKNQIAVSVIALNCYSK